MNFIDVCSVLINHSIRQSGMFIEVAKNRLIALFNMPTGNKRSNFEERNRDLSQLAIEVQDNIQLHMRQVKVMKSDFKGFFVKEPKQQIYLFLLFFFLFVLLKTSNFSFNSL